jgi:hypothetical protein
MWGDLKDILLGIVAMALYASLQFLYSKARGRFREADGNASEGSARPDPVAVQKRFFFIFWIYNMVVGFLPTICPSFLTRYHWWMFAAGLVLLFLALNAPGRRR